MISSMFLEDFDFVIIRILHKKETADKCPITNKFLDGRWR